MILNYSLSHAFYTYLSVDGEYHTQVKNTLSSKISEIGSSGRYLSIYRKSGCCNINNSYLHERHDFQGDCRQIQGVHHEVHQIPPVVDVILKATVPHLLDFPPNETCNDKKPRCQGDSQSSCSEQVHHSRTAASWGCGRPCTVFCCV